MSRFTVFAKWFEGGGQGYAYYYVFDIVLKGALRGTKSTTQEVVLAKIPNWEQKLEQGEYDPDVSIWTNWASPTTF